MYLTIGGTPFLTFGCGLAALGILALWGFAAASTAGDPRQPAEHTERGETRRDVSRLLLVEVAWPGAEPEEVRRELADPLQEAISTTTGVESITSISSIGRLEVYVGVAGAGGAQAAMRDLRAVCDSLSDRLPDAATGPTVALLPPEAAIPRVKVEPGPRVQVELNRERMARLGVTATAVAEAIRKHGGTRPRKNERMLKLANVPIATGNGAFVPLNAVAEFHLTKAPSHIVTRWPEEGERPADASPATKEGVQESPSDAGPSLQQLLQQFEQRVLDEVWAADNQDATNALDDIGQLTRRTAKIAREVYGDHPRVLRARAEQLLGDLPTITPDAWAGYVVRHRLENIPKLIEAEFGTADDANEPRIEELFLASGWDPKRTALITANMLLARAVPPHQLGKRMLLSRFVPDRVHRVTRGGPTTLAVKSLDEYVLVEVRLSEAGIVVPVSAVWMTTAEATEGKGDEPIEPQPKE